MKYFSTLIISLLCAFSTLNAQNKKTNVQDVGMFTSTENAAAMQNFMKAEKAFNKGAFKKATSLYKLAYSQDSSFLDALDNLALSFRNQNLMDSAIHYYKLSLSKNIENQGVLTNLGLVYIYQEQYSDAVNTFTTLMQYFPDDLSALQLMSTTYLYAEDYTNALEWGQKCFDKAGVANKDLSSEALYNICVSLVKLNRKDEALTLYNKAQRWGIENPDAAVELGIK